ncbi:hypothetical protein SDC9_146072 [bioreactor metagenome]|uniref:Uncharacterized protein n=1 Tax=bioreactor metagenome TaxID=1076179 RepID=A0A645EE58_9ZZZZ
MKKLRLDIVLMNEQHLYSGLTTPNMTIRMLADVGSQSILGSGVRETGWAYDQ